jgi:hypothetical protein
VEAGAVKAVRKGVNEAFPIQATFILPIWMQFGTKCAHKNVLRGCEFDEHRLIGSRTYGRNEYLSYFPHLWPDLGGIRCVICAYNVEST